MSDPTKPVPRKTEELPRTKPIGPDLRKEIRYLSNRTGFSWVGLRQADYSKRSADIIDQDSGTTNSSVQGGNRTTSTGYTFTDFLVKIFTWEATLGVKFDSGMGWLSTQTKNIVLEHNRPVNKFDLLLELDTDSNTGEPRQPFRIMRVFEIQDVHPLIGDGSRVEFYKCSIEERNLTDNRAYQPGQSNVYRSNRGQYDI